MLFFKLRPLYCENCSIETAQQINNIENIDFVMPGQILIIPQKCANYSWKDNYNYKNKLATYSDSDITDILKKRVALKPEPITETGTESITTEAKITEANSATANMNSKISLPAKIQKVAYNKLGVEPFAIFSEITGKSGLVDAKLVTNFGKGVSAYYQKI